MTSFEKAVNRRVSRPIKKIVSTDLKGTKPGKKRFEYGTLNFDEDKPEDKYTNCCANGK